MTEKLNHQRDETYLILKQPVLSTMFLKLLCNTIQAALYKLCFNESNLSHLSALSLDISAEKPDVVLLPMGEALPDINLPFVGEVGLVQTPMSFRICSVVQLSAMGAPVIIDIFVTGDQRTVNPMDLCMVPAWLVHIAATPDAATTEMTDIELDLPTPKFMFELAKATVALAGEADASATKGGGAADDLAAAPQELVAVAPAGAGPPEPLLPAFLRVIIPSLSLKASVAATAPVTLTRNLSPAELARPVRRKGKGKGKPKPVSESVDIALLGLDAARASLPEDLSLVDTATSGDSTKGAKKIGLYEISHILK